MQDMCCLGLKAFRQQLFLHKFFKRSWLMQFGVHVVCVPNTTGYTVCASKKQSSGTVEAVWALRDVEPWLAFCTITPPLPKMQMWLVYISRSILKPYLPFCFPSRGIFSLRFSVWSACLCVDRTLLHIHNRKQRADNSESTFSIRPQTAR